MNECGEPGQQAMTAKRIVIVDHDPKFCEMLSEQLNLYEDYSCQSFHDAASVLADIEAAGPDILLVGCGLGDMSLQSFCEAVREKGLAVPIIFMLRSDDEEDDADLAEFIGANDCLIRPFLFADLLVRVQASMRVRDMQGDDDIVIGLYRLRPSAKVLLMRDGDGAESKIRLTEKESDILKFLADEDGQVVSREVLLAEVWGYNSGVTTHTLETHIYRLRQKIEQDPSDAKYLVTEPGGYRLVR